MRRIISVILALNIAFCGVFMTAHATQAQAVGTDIENLTFSDEDSMLYWDSKGTDYGGANIYKYSEDGSIQMLGYTNATEYEYPENGTYLIRPLTKDNTELEGKVITTVAPENSVSITDVSLTDQGSYKITVKNITEYYIRCKVLVELINKSGEVAKYGYGKALIPPGKTNEFKLYMPKPDSFSHAKINVYDDSDNRMTGWEADDYHRYVIEKNQNHIAKLKTLLSECEEKGISTDYETANYKVMERFDTYLQDDFKNSVFDNTYYTDVALDKLYNEAKDNLTAYLKGEKEPRKVPKYVNSNMRIDGDSVYAMTELDGKTEERPVFFVGYGHFGQAAKDMPFFKEIGANTIQTEIGPTDVMISSEFPCWEFNNNQEPQYTAQISDEDAYEGNKALKITYNSELTPNQFISFSQYVPVEAGKIYNFKGYMKTQNTTDAWLSLNNWDDRIKIPQNSAWTEIKATYTAPEGATKTVVRLNCDAVCNAWYIDNLSFCEEGSNVNLLQNGGFEANYNEDYQMSANSIKLIELENILNDAQKNDISVSVLLSPHYFPESIIQKYGIAHNDGASSFIKYNVNADIAKQVIEEYLRMVIPKIKDYTSLNSICLSNEPLFKPESCGDFYLDEWHNFLKEKYGSTWNLYLAYGKYYLSFDRVPLGYSNSAMEYDYKLFNDKVFSRWHRWMAGIIHELAPDVPLYSKIMAYVDDDDTQARMKRGVGYESYYDFFELNGCDAHNYINDGSGLYQVDDGYLVEEMWYDYMRSIKDAPVINAEDHIIPDRSRNYSDDVTDYVAQNIYMGAIHGRAISDIWVWERSYDKTSDFDGSILNRPDTIAAISKATFNLNANAYEITALKDAEKEVGILYSDSSMIYDDATSFATYQAYSACLYSGKAVQFVTPSQLEKMNNCKVLIVPQATYVSGETLDYIKSFIENGGKVMIIGQSSLKKNEKGSDNNSDKLNFIFANSYVIDYNGTKNTTGSITESGLYDEVRKVLDMAGIYNIFVKDAKTGEAVDYVEYNIGAYNGDIILNMVSYEEDKDVNVYIGDKLVSSSYDINNQTELSETISLKRYVPVTVRIDN
ncbi:MAG: beta-galactosidase [Clostridia bacterium]|nr:beta-galactosidase [Clostridia bacterium]